MIKANRSTAAIPIIALTAHVLASDRDRNIEVGRSDFDTKPVDMQRLLGKLRACLPARGSDPLTAQPSVSGNHGANKGLWAPRERCIKLRASVVKD